MASHTPGPWTCVVGVMAPFVNQEARTVRPHYVVNQTDRHAPPVITEMEAKANARLIAAAPELLAALRLCRSAINEEIIAAGDLDHPTIRAHATAAEQADAAIAKAEGR